MPYFGSMSHSALGGQFRLFHGGPSGLSHIDGRIGEAGANTPAFEDGDEPANYSTTSPSEAASYASLADGHSSVYEVEHHPGDIWPDAGGSERYDLPEHEYEEPPEDMDQAREYLTKGGDRWLAFSHEKPLRIVREMSLDEAEELSKQMGLK